MRKVIKKLKSDTGATLMMALLFFVVCAVTGSMILVSATASSGRLEGMRQQDQNYYAVSSAVKFVEEKLSNEYLSVEETLEIDEETDTETDEEGNEREVITTYYDYSGPKFYLKNKTDAESKTEITIISVGLLGALLTDDNITNYKEKLDGVVSHSTDYPDAFNLKWFKDSGKSDGSGETVTGGTDNGEGDGTGSIDDGEGDMTGSSPEDSDDEPDTILSVETGSKELDVLNVDIDMTLDSTGLLTVTFKNSEMTSDEDDSEDGQNSSDTKVNRYKMILKMQCNKKRDLEDTSDEMTRTRIHDFSFETISIEKA